jgi:hypothetical protein
MGFSFGTRVAYYGLRVKRGALEAQKKTPGKGFSLDTAAPEGYYVSSS